MKRALKYFYTLCLCLLFTAPAYALQITFNDGDQKTHELIQNTVAFRRLSALETTDGALFWTRRLVRDGEKNLQSLGFYEARIETVLAENKTGVLINVIPGPSITVRELTIDLPQTALKEIVFPLKKGDRLDHNLYEQGKLQLHGWLLANGYLSAKMITHRLEVNKKERSAKIFLAWEIGEQYTFGPVTFVDNKLSSTFLNRYIPFVQGDVFTEKQLQKFSEQLRTSGYFASVDIIPLLDKTQNLSVPIEVRLQPLKRTVYELGVSMGTDQGVGLEADVTRRRANANGHNWKLQSAYTTQRSMVGARYAIPSRRHLDRVTRVDLTYVDELTDTSQRETLKGTLSKQRQFHKWQRIDSASMLDEQFTIAGITERSSFLISSLDLTRTKAKDTINPVKGWRARVTLSGASDALGSSTSFVRSDLEYKRIGSFSEKSRWLMRTRLGALWVDDFGQLPTSLRFYAGGDRSIRGFDFEALGPIDADGNVIGGQSIATASLEVDHLVAPKWRIASFVDAGNAFGPGSESIEYAAGLGVRWLSPIGPVRLDFANALSRDTDPWRVHFSIGPDL